MNSLIVVTALYAPASRPELLPKALASGADAVFVDLEDAVVADRKDAARANALAFLDDLPDPPANHPHDAPGRARADRQYRDPGAVDQPPGERGQRYRLSGHARLNYPPGDLGAGDQPSGQARKDQPPGDRGPQDWPPGDLGAGDQPPGRARVSRSRGRPAGLPVVQVRVNHPRGDFGPRDLAALGAHSVVRAGCVGVRLPKVAEPDDVDLALELLDMDVAPPVFCLLESAAGVENAARIAEHPAVAGLALGEADLANELDLRGEDAFAWIRSRIVIAAIAAGLPAPAMAVYTDLADPQGLAASCAKGRALGMFGRSAVHPKQLPTIAAAFTPGELELRRAHEVVTAAAGARADGSGAIVLPDGRFIDAPMVEHARRTIRLGERLS